MKKPAIFAISIALGAVLSGCNGTEPQSSTPEAAVHVAGGIWNTSDSVAKPDGQKKIGPYIWVWRTVTLYKETTVETDCPVNDAVISGGIKSANSSGIHGSYPNAALTGWIVSVFGYGRGTAFAGCAPVK
jgi:hypothetical protein